MTVCKKKLQKRNDTVFMYDKLKYDKLENMKQNTVVLNKKTASDETVFCKNLFLY